MSISSVQAAPPPTELTLFDFLGAMVEAEDGWVDPLDLLDEPVAEGLDENGDQDVSSATDKSPEAVTVPVNEEEMQR